MTICSSVLKKQRVISSVTTFQLHAYFAVFMSNALQPAETTCFRTKRGVEKINLLWKIYKRLI